MNMYGMCVVDDFLGSEYGLSILNEVHQLYAAGVFQNGQVVSGTETDVKTIRGDQITWVRGTEPHCKTIGFLINQVSVHCAALRAFVFYKALFNFSHRSTTL